MSNTTKTLSDVDSTQVLEGAYNVVDSSITTNGFLVGVVGRKIAVSITTTTIASDTEVYAFSENGTALYTLKLVYTDGTRAQLSTATRTA